MKFLTARQKETLEGRLKGERGDSRVWNYLRSRLPDVLESFLEEVVKQTRALGEWEERRRLKEERRLAEEAFWATWEKETDPEALLTAAAEGLMNAVRPPASGAQLAERLILRLLEGLDRKRRGNLLSELYYRQEWPDRPAVIHRGVGTAPIPGDFPILPMWHILEAAWVEAGKTAVLRQASVKKRPDAGLLLERMRAKGLVDWSIERTGRPGRPLIRLQLKAEGKRLLRSLRHREIIPPETEEDRRVALFRWLFSPEALPSGRDSDTGYGPARHTNRGRKLKR